MTWFDALLVTLWAVITALGARRGLAGLAWGVGGLAAAFLANALVGGPLAALLSAALGVGIATVILRLVPMPLENPWHLGAGAVGGFVLGGVLISTLALGFPLDVKVGTEGKRGVYPSPSLPPVLYRAVSGSAVQNGLRSVWGGSPALKTLLMPDQARAR
ncbi:hypothetical protein GO986_21105 [Deinococcus sp. HMF7620]|uniref:Colicin V production protein n=1 Tax=Deinococcus arboris TaxID=2682977 RepID=A0A7C9LQ17_9DEIO|nr:MULTISPECIES: hypothetical protein [Deinococcus]MBZ9750897.1 hypothetical protein [Deinococcus betulae]MVN89237.1 hypothetical protein [Deinococcus arboris]